MERGIIRVLLPLDAGCNNGEGENRVSRSLFSSHEFGFQGRSFLNRLTPEDTESPNMSLFVHALHDGIVGSGTHEPPCITELHFQKISLRVEPDFYFFGHMVAPALSSVRIKLLRQEAV
jgi:hypothetical protein